MQKHVIPSHAAAWRGNPPVRAEIYQMQVKILGDCHGFLRNPRNDSTNYLPDKRELARGGHNQTNTRASVQNSPGFLLFWEDSPKSCCFLHKFSPHLVFRQIPRRIYGIMATRTTGAAEPQRQWHRPSRPPARMPESSPPTPQTVPGHPATPGARHPLRRHRR